MLKLNNIAKKAITTVIATTMLTLNINISAVIAESDPDEIPLPPAENQYLEMRVTSIKEVEGNGKQVIMKLYGHNLEFKGFDVRFSYDGTIFETSNIETNIPTSNAKEFCKLESEFSSCTEFFTLEYTKEGTGMRGVFSFDPPVNETEHIKEKDGIGKVIITGEELLIGEFSFNLKSDEFNMSSFKLETGDNFPTKGIDINLDGTHCFEEQTVFRFEDKTASKDAYLSNLIVSSGEIDENNPENSTYKEYELVPTFEKETTKYELTLMEYIDILNIKVTQNDTKSTIKMKVPKRDENNELQYEEDGQTIIYEEKEIQNNINEPVTINKLGEPDTLVTIIVTAEDGKTINNYELTIKRPYGTIKGSIQLGNGLRESMNGTYGTFLEYIANVTLYSSQEFEWQDVVDLNIPLSDLSKHKKLDEIQTEGQNGKFEMKIIPGSYDLYLNKEGFVPIVINDIELKEGDTFDIGNKILYEGDADCNGIVDLDDLVEIIYRKDKLEGDLEYRKSCDFGRKGYIALDDIISQIANKDKYITIEEFDNKEGE